MADAKILDMPMEFRLELIAMICPDFADAERELLNDVVNKIDRIGLCDRADIYIPFIERSLSVLSEGGNLGFICADRWMKNRYGGPLRSLVAEWFHQKIYVDMVDTPAFHSEVIA